MKRTTPLALFFLTTIPVACSQATGPTGAVDEALVIGKPPIAPGHPITPITFGSSDSCNADLIQYAPSNQNLCRGGFEYTPYVANCYNGSATPSPACGPLIRWGKTSCNYPTNCRMQQFGVERALPDDTWSPSYNAVVDDFGSGCNDFLNELENAFDISNRRDNWGVLQSGYSRGTYTSSWTNRPAPATETCNLRLSGVVLYNTFDEYNDNVFHGRMDDEDPADNPCPINPVAVACQEDPIYPTCNPSTNPSQKSLGLDPKPWECGLAAGSLAYSATNVTQASFEQPYSHLSVNESCTSCEDALIDDPSSLATNGTSATKAQKKLACIASRINDVTNGRSPATTFNPALKSQLGAEMKLLSELEGQLLTPGQQDTVWQADIQNDDAETCEGDAWAPSTAPPAACAVPAAPTGVNTDFPTYMRRTLTACSRFEQPHATIAATTAFAPRCFLLSKDIPADSYACVSTPGPGPGPIPIETDSVGAPTQAGAKTAAAANLMLPHPRCVSPDIVGFGGTSSVLCSNKVYRDEYRSVANALIMKLVGSLVIANGSDSTSEIQSKLALIEQWYEGMSALYPPGSDRTALWGDVGAVIGTFWQVAFNPPFTTAKASAQSTDPNTIGNISNMFVSDATEVVRKVFLASFTPDPSAGNQPPLHSAPLLYLLGDGIQTITNRLEYVGLYHDLACRFRGCIGGNVQTEVSQMWGLFSKLADSKSLTGLVTNNAKFLRVPWYNVFDGMQKTHAQTIQPATVDAYGGPTYDPTLLAAGNAGTLPTPALALSQVIQRATIHSNNYMNTGLLGSNATNTVDIGLQNATLGTNSVSNITLTGEITRLEADLTKAISTYQDGQKGVVNGILSQLTNTQKDAELKTQLASTLVQFKHYNDEMNAFADSDAAQEAAFGQFMQAYNGVTNGPATDKDLMVTRSFFNTTVDPKGSGKGSGSSWSNIQDIAVQKSGGGNLPTPMVTSQGWILNIQTSGKWTPTCALRSISLPSQSAPLDVSQVESAQAGPEGYYLSASSSGSMAVANSTVTSASASVNESADLKTCAGVKTEAGFDIFGDGATAYTDTSACLQLSAGLSASYGVNGTTTGSQEGRVSASFSSGIRAANAPFPSAPVGALLLVEMKHLGTTPQDLIDVKIVQSPTMSVLIDADADVYLVDNDIANCSYTAPGSLSLAITELEPTKDALLPIGGAMVNALTLIQKTGTQIIAQKKILPDDMASLRASAMLELGKATPANFTVPAALITLFTAYVDEAILHLERLVEMANDQYQEDLINISLKGINDDIAANADQARYYQLLTAYSLVNLDSDALASVLNPLLSYVMNELYPAAVLRYPAAIPAIQQNAATLLDKLTTKLDWTNVDVNLAQQAGILVQSIEGTFEDAAFRTPPQTMQTQVLVSFRNPDFVPPTVFGQTTGYKWPWPGADSARAQAVWTAVKNGTVASITLTPEDIYLNNTQGSLPCARFTPIIDNFALFVGGPANNTSTLDTLTLNGGQPATLRVHDEIGYALPTGLDLYHFINPDGSNGSPWLTGSSVYVIGGDPSVLLQTFNNTIKNFPSFTAAAGLSPFGTFDIDMAGVKRLIDSTNGIVMPELDLVMQVETNPAPSDLTWIRTCKPASSSGTGVRPNVPIVVGGGGGISTAGPM